MNARGVLVRLQKSYGEFDRAAAPVLVPGSAAGADVGL